MNHLYLIRLLDFYFAFMFFAGLYRRASQYHQVASLVLAGPRRWPNLLKLIREHRMMFWTLSTIRPALLALVLSVVQIIASRFIWPEAGRGEQGLTLENLVHMVFPLLYAVPLCAGMLGMDIYSLVVVGQIDRAQIEGQLDQAEYWLTSNTSAIVRVVTFGFVDPHRIVNEELRKGLTMMLGLVNYSLWWVTIQVSIRFCFGLSLWLTWAWTR